MNEQESEPEASRHFPRPPFYIRGLLDLWATSLVGEAVRGEYVHSTVGRVAMGVVGAAELVVSLANGYPPLINRDSEPHDTQ